MMIGIDLGTTNSLAACFRNGKVEMIPNRLGKMLTPSVVAIDGENQILVGETAKEYSILHPVRAAKVFKRSMGTDKQYDLGNRKMRSEELSSLILRSLKEDAESYLGCPVEEAIISVPAYFNEFQRKATKQAGELAGLKVQRIINEPTAAAIAYGVGDQDKDETCLVFDLGGGTFDVSILSFYKNIMEVHAVAGDNFLGGEDFTLLLANMFLERSVIAPEALDIKTMNRVMKEAEKAKCAFAHQDEVTITCTIDGTEVSQNISLSSYEKACQQLLEKMRTPLERSIRDSHFRISDIDRVVLVGGATRLPVIRKFVARMFNRFPDNVDPDMAVAMGVALQVGMKQRDKEIKEVILTDVCPFTLGTEINKFNGYFDESNHYMPIIERNTVIPVSRTETVYTAHDNQTRVRIKILQGESRIASNNIPLGEIVVPVPANPKGVESVDITYTYDVNSLLEVIVKVNSTGVSRKVVVQGGDKKLSDEEIAKRFEELSYLKQSPRDEEENKLILLRAERMYEESYGDARSRIDYGIMMFEHVLSKGNHEEIKRARKELEELLSNL